jgi:hypothetical protein
MDSKEKKLKEISDKIKSYDNKIKFSTISLVFFITMAIVHSMNPVFGIFTTYGFGILSVVFIQQIIRSYNYVKFYEVSYNAHKILYDTFDK